MMGAVASAVWKAADDVVFAVWFASKLKPREEVKGAAWWRNQIIGIFLLGFCCFLTSVKANVFSSFGWRLIGTMIYLRICKKDSWNKTLYESGIFTLAYYGNTIIFVTPVLAGVRRGEIPIIASSVMLNRIVVQLFMWFVSALLVWAVRNGIDYSRIENRWQFRGGMCAGLSILEIYMKYTLNEFSHRETQIVEMTVFALIIMTLIMVVLIFVEQYFVNEDREAERQRVELLQTYQYENMKERMAASQDVRCMYHDLKNHLISISTIAGDDVKVQHYLADMKARLEGFESGVETGNAMLDGILAEKMKLARLNGITMSIYVDFSKITFIRDMDICTIFGNAIDNAIEASLKTEEKEKRYIQIKSGEFANNLVIKIANYCEDRVSMENGLPVTTKRDTKLHGLGLLSVKKTVAEYKGVIAVEQEGEQFVLKIMIPM